MGEQGRGPSDRLRAGNEEVKICLLARSDSIHRGRGREREREGGGGRISKSMTGRPAVTAKYGRRTKKARWRESQNTAEGDATLGDLFHVGA